MATAAGHTAAPDMIEIIERILSWRDSQHAQKFGQLTGRCASIRLVASIGMI
jgi:hypothetical protein